MDVFIDKLSGILRGLRKTSKKENEEKCLCMTLVYFNPLCFNFLIIIIYKTHYTLYTFINFKLSFTKKGMPTTSEVN